MENYFYGILDLSFWQYVGLSVASFMISMMSITLYLHRDQAHRAIDLHPILKHFFRFWLWVNSGAMTDEWVAVHRKHHAMCEREGDPHSPQVFGIRKVLLEGAELYQAEAANAETVAKYSRGTPQDWIERNLYKRFRNGGIWLLVIGSLLLLGGPGIIYLGIQLIAMPVMAAGIINGLGHFSGYRNFECDDASTNLTPIAVIIGGEELHNNHHAFPTSAKFSVRPWEFDIGWMYICIFRALGLCEVRRLAPKPRVSRSRHVDLQTLQAVLVNRMHVLREYTNRVTLPVLKTERLAEHRNEMLAKARRLFVARPETLDAVAHGRLKKVLDNNQKLKKVHEYREKLVKIWEQANVSNEQLVEQLKEWCAEAEASGIHSLEEFSERLRGYILPPAVAA
ncbi:MAG: fatty acid desaturase [Gammaproteobacteria bacterium]|jgi:stearoyl-CoA desaturase (delta-9 desaturase)